MTLLALQDLFRRHRERATGLWKLGGEPSRTIFIESGDIVFAQSTHSTDRLTYLLVERGKLTQAQLDYALANLKPGFSIGKNLIEMGFITQRDLLEVARAQVERVVQGALGTPELEPHFEAKELDTTVVRLPLDTPQLLLNGLLNLQDRERLLELLGPLNQVVVLVGRRLSEMNLPADLAKLPPLLDGTHTLLELSREAFAEPLRLGTFALFLREIGWARLHEMPPLDRQALDLALTSELEPLSRPLPEPLPETVPSLFSTIQDAGRPTTNLEHLSHALDALPEPEPSPAPAFSEDIFLLEEDRTPESPLMLEPAPVVDRAVPMPDLSGFAAETGQAVMPTPNMELPEPPFAQEAEPEPEMLLRASTLTQPEAPIPVPSEAAEAREETRRSKRPLLGFAALLLVLAAAGGGWWWSRLRAKPNPIVQPPPPVPPTPAKPVTPGIAVPPPTETTGTPKPEALKPEPPKPEPPKPPAVIGTTLAERTQAMMKGDLELAMRQGKAFAKEGSPKQWTLRLEIACLGDTLKHAVEVFPEGQADLFVLPIELKDGRTCYQVFYGKFHSKAEAEKRSGGLPQAFHEGGNRPKAFPISELPSRQ